MILQRGKNYQKIIPNLKSLAFFCVSSYYRFNYYKFLFYKL
ncbi:hypothetical protein G436_3070 [Leptospira interrogans serovar Hardjo str. Norma]|uniref:Uncharacterized protein n=1 Tax=Leptospira interrogans serovar Hardjo str. Norma TaxID=1279460 RepID=A0A0M3TM52_LEPIR|nr:hypothetical protein G436_3070 [Leptospira interrogans serovar Hardjo str. Norma]